jgi:5S rRNA maturation endonuclease (ribonuclease M5)
MEEYAKDNTLIYTTHLPFMIDLRQPERIRIFSETNKGIVVTEDLTESQPEARFVLQAALGMSGSSSYLVAQRNLVVEGVDDFWILTELSGLMRRAGKTYLSEDVLITPAGGAAEAAYIATFMIGQKLDVIVLLDSDKAGGETRDKLVKKWLTRYQSSKSNILSLGECVGKNNREFSIEDIFHDDFYIQRVREVYEKELRLAGATNIKLVGNDQLCKRVERFFAEHDILFNKGRVAKVLRSQLSRMNKIDELPNETQEMAINIFTKISAIFPPEDKS